MPPSTRRKAAADAAPAQPPALAGVTACFSGTFSGFTHGALEKRINSLGGSISRNMSGATGVLITTPTDFKGQTAKVTQASTKGIPIVSLEWLDECEAKSQQAAYKDFEFKTAAAASTARASPSPPPAAPAAAAPAAPAAPAATTDATTATAKPLPSRKRAAKAPPATKDEEPKSKKAKKVKAEPEPEPKEEEEEDAAKPDDNDDAKDEDEGPGQYLRKGSKLVIPIDEYCNMAGYQVYVDPDTRLIYDAHLSQSNYSRNNNKFYRVQVIHNKKDNKYHAWTRWGRVGDPGATGLLGDGALNNAIKNFESKFKAKSGNAWKDRDNAPGKDKYMFRQQNYEAEEAMESKLNGFDYGRGAKDQAAESSAPSKLEVPVQNLMKLIFNDQYMAHAMSAMKYDARRLPLGKLDKSVIMKAYGVLKDLMDVIDDPLTAQSKHDATFNTVVENMSNQYFSAIPHDFGRARIPVLNNANLVKAEIELLDNLVDMKLASDLMSTKKTDGEAVNKLDVQFAGLGLEEMTPLDTTTSEFQNIADYLHGTRGATHHMKYAVEDIFRIGRPNEDARFQDFKVPSSNRRLLWHGSRATNFGGILSQGLRIAPPEAPVSGYMFGKGIYLADMSSKSAGYTCYHNSGGTGLLLLCEAELGDPMLELTNADYNAGTFAKSENKVATWGQGKTGPSLWKDASCIHPSLAGVQMPDISTKPGDTKVANAYLYYNEYIVYDISQVKLRYLLRVKMN